MRAHSRRPDPAREPLPLFTSQKVWQALTVLAHTDTHPTTPSASQQPLACTCRLRLPRQSSLRLRNRGAAAAALPEEEEGAESAAEQALVITEGLVPAGSQNGAIAAESEALSTPMAAVQ